MMRSVMMVSGLRVMWRIDRPSSTVVSSYEVSCHRCSSVVRDRRTGRARVGVVADDGEEDLLQGGLFLDVLDLGGREELLQLGEGAVRDDPSLVEDRDPVGELFGLVEVLRGEQHRGALPASSLTLFHTSRRDCGSSPVVGSSRKITGGSPMRLMAMSSRRRMPPEYVDTLRRPASTSSNRSSSSSAIRPASFRCRNLATSTRFSPPGEDLVHGSELPGEAEGLPHVRRLRGDVEAIDRRRPRVGPEQGGEDLHDRGLAGAVGAEQREDAAPRHVEVHAAQHVQVLVGLLQSLHADRRGRLGCHREVPSVPCLRAVSSAAARSTALVSRLRSRTIQEPSG